MHDGKEKKSTNTERCVCMCVCDLIETTETERVVCDLIDLAALRLALLRQQRQLQNLLHVPTLPPTGRQRLGARRARKGEKVRMEEEGRKRRMEGEGEGEGEKGRRGEGRRG
eukprot:1053323-Rhodomonas_salina.1